MIAVTFHSARSGGVCQPVNQRRRHTRLQALTPQNHANLAGTLYCISLRQCLLMVFQDEAGPFGPATVS
jgi:hypothetical protein